MKITAQDFEHLVEQAMSWDLNQWAEQLNRFSFDKFPDDGVIYWVENYSSFMLCRQFLAENGYTFIQSFDEGAEQWCFITNYDFCSVKADA
jgi:hypothetical protein